MKINYFTNPLWMNMLSDVIVKLLNLLTILAVTFFLNSDKLVQYSLFLIVITIFMDTICNYILHLSVKDNIYQANLKILSLVILASIAFVFLKFENLKLVISIGLYSFTYLVLGVTRIYYQIKQDFRQFNIINILRAINLNVSMIFYCFGIIENLAHTLVVAAVFNCIIATIYRTSYNKIEIKKNIALDVIGYLFLMALAGQIEIIIMESLYSDEEVAPIILLMRFLTIPIMMLTALNNFFLPTSRELEEQSSSTISTQAVTVIILFNALCTFVVIFYFDWLTAVILFVTSTILVIPVKIAFRLAKLLSHGYHLHLCFIYMISAAMKTALIFIFYNYHVNALLTYSVSFTLGIIFVNMSIQYIHANTSHNV